MSNPHNTPEALYLIDGSIYIFQAHFSPYVECTDEAGEQLSALFGFAQFLLQFMRRMRPTHLAVALDESLFQGFRHRLCPRYKSNRELPDENLAMQLKGCHEICELLGVAAFVSREYEADDIIGTIGARVRQQTEGRVPVQIVSRDKDLAQLLVHDHDCLWDFARNHRRHPADFIKEYGITPAQLPDFLALTGDSVDCIPGIPGIGPVKATALLQKFGTLEAVLDAPDEAAAMSFRGAQKIAPLLVEHRAQAELSKKLATIVCDVTDGNETFTEVTLSHITRRPCQNTALDEFCQTYHFQDEDRRHLLHLARTADETLNGPPDGLQ